MLWEIFLEASIDSLNIIWQIAKIVFPVMILIRIAKELNLLNRVCTFFEPATQKVFMPKEATFPLIVGLVFGLQYGAGVILQAVKEGQLQGRDLFLLNVFLGLCHAIIEDTFIFIAIGANLWGVFVLRILIALVLTYMIGRYLVSRYDSNLVPLEAKTASNSIGN